MINEKKNLKNLVIRNFIPYFTALKFNKYI